MLYGETFECELPATLIAGRLEHLSIDLQSAAAAAQARRATEADIQTVRQAIADGRYPAERAIDHVVERLLEELTW